MNNVLSYIHWNVDPEIFKLWIFSIRYYGLFFASGFLIGYYMVEKMMKLEGVNPKWVDSLFFYLIIATILGSRLGHVFFYSWDYYSQHPEEILKVWHGGLASHGGAVGILVAIFIYSKVITKRTMLWTMDRIVVPIALVAAFIRLGNLMNSEIYGTATTMPWGVIFERNGETVAKHPTQIYEALSYLFSFGVLNFLYWKTSAKNRPGLIMGAFFVLMFSARFLIEFIKEDQEAFEAGMMLNMGQWLSIPFILCGVFLIYRAVTKPEIVFNNKYKKIKK